MKTFLSSRKAFTLIEIAMVLIVMGIIVGSSTKIFISLSKNAKTQETKEHMKLLTLDIEGFSTTFNRLPTQKEFESFHMQIKDAWGKPIIYVPSKMLLSSLCNHKRTTLEHRQNDKSIKNLAFMLISSGANRNLQTEVTQGDRSIIKSAQLSQRVDFNTLKTNRIEPFDDLYLSRSLWSLQAQARCSQRNFQ